MKIFLLDNIITDCTASSYLYQRVKTFFILNGYLITDKIIEADYIVINTCGVWKSTEEKFLEIIKNSNLKNNSAKIIVFGCLPKISSELSNLPYIFKLIPLKDENIFDEIFFRNFSIKNVTSKDFDTSYFDKLNSSHQNTKNIKRYYIEIARGCIHSCSYCITKKSIGYVKSVDKELILNSIRYASDNGFEEIVLVSDDVTSYGKDIGLNFVDLLESMCEFQNVNFNINYAEPGEFMKIFPLIKKYFHRINEITIPIQSFSDKILGLMRRNYNVKDYLDLIEDMRKTNPNVYISNHIIFGYPTESKQDFLHNIAGAKYFDTTLYNLYSFRKGTLKFESELLVNKNELKERIGILLKLNKKNSLLFNFGNYEDDLVI